MQHKLWVLKDISEALVNKLAADAGISKLMARVLINRNITEADAVKEFLYPSLDKLHDPNLLKDMQTAVDRIIKALENKEQIVIFGDYDVDGVTSVSILYDFLKTRGAEVRYYIPERLEEGYGLSKGAAEKLVFTGATLIITVDCGITSIDEVNFLNQNGIEVVVTDHHQCRIAISEMPARELKTTLPEAAAVVNPCRPDCTYPFKGLAGVGVAFKLVQALCAKLGAGRYYEKYLDLLALGTVADVVALMDENRIFVKYGLKAIEKTLNPGLRALINVSGLRDKPLTAYSLGFMLAPRVNAAGRVGSASRAVRLFTTDDRVLAETIAKELDDENRRRQETEAFILNEALELIESGIDLEKEKIIVVAKEGWHHGIIGIVASKITDRYHRPSVLISIDGNTDEEGLAEEDGQDLVGRGSARSIEGFNLFKAISYCGELLEKFGGHEMAAGLSIKVSNIEGFKKRINEYADSILTESDLISCVRVDAYMDGEDICESKVSEMELLAPFGSSNPGPVFACRGMKVKDVNTVGGGKHLKLKLGCPTTAGTTGLDAKTTGAETKGAEAIGFNLGLLADTFTSGDLVDAAFSLEINNWNNSKKVQLNLKDIRINE